MFVYKSKYFILKSNLVNTLNAIVMSSKQFSIHISVVLPTILLRKCGTLLTALSQPDIRCPQESVSISDFTTEVKRTDKLHDW